RALDYLPPTDLTFSDYLSALLTADIETYLDDEPFGYRRILVQSFADYGIVPASTSGEQNGQWAVPRRQAMHGFSHAEPMKTEAEAVFRFVWENRSLFRIHPEAFTRVLSVRPVTRTGHDGFVVRETVAEVMQTLEVRADELGRLDVEKPERMPDSTPVRLYGSNAIIFDEFGQLKYDVGTSMKGEKQSERIASLWRRGAFSANARRPGSFADMHRQAAGQVVPPEESW
ncbi:MAG: hypothetical protein RLN69_03565, partial [Woeseiaceae bacterium]